MKVLPFSSKDKSEANIKVSAEKVKRSSNKVYMWVRYSKIARRRIERIPGRIIWKATRKIFTEWRLYYQQKKNDTNTTIKVDFM